MHQCTVQRLVHTDHVKRSRIGQFNASVKRAQIENSLSYCINACDLHRSERAIRYSKKIVQYCLLDVRRKDIKELILDAAISLVPGVRIQLGWKEDLILKIIDVKGVL